MCLEPVNELAQNEQKPSFPSFYCSTFQKMCGNTFWKSPIWLVAAGSHPQQIVCVSVPAQKKFILCFFGLIYFLESVQAKAKDIENWFCVGPFKRELKGKKKILLSSVHTQFYGFYQACNTSLG